MLLTVLTGTLGTRVHWAMGLQAVLKEKDTNPRSFSISKGSEKEENSTGQMRIKG